LARLLYFAVCLSPSLWWAYYVSLSGFFLCFVIGGLVFLYESGILNSALTGARECSLIRINRSGEWSLFSEEEGETRARLTGTLKTGSLMILRFTLKRSDNPEPGSRKILSNNILRNNNVVLLVRKQPSTETAFHRLNLYLSQ